MYREINRYDELPHDDRPQELEDTGRKPWVSLSGKQARALRELTQRFPKSTVALTDEGSGYVGVVFFDAEGQAIERRLIFADGGYGTQDLPPLS